MAAYSTSGRFYGFKMAVDLNVREGHAAKSNRIAPLPATEQWLQLAKRPVCRDMESLLC